MGIPRIQFSFYRLTWKAVKSTSIPTIYRTTNFNDDRHALVYAPTPSSAPTHTRWSLLRYGQDLDETNLVVIHELHVILVVNERRIHTQFLCNRMVDLFVLFKELRAQHGRHNIRVRVACHHKAPLWFPWNRGGLGHNGGHQWGEFGVGDRVPEEPFSLNFVLFSMEVLFGGASLVVFCASLIRR